VLSLQYDNDADGSIDRVDSYILNLYGQRVETQNDTDNDTHPDTITYSTLNIKGRAIKSEYDYGADGSIDRIYEQPRNKYGEETFRSMDTDVVSDLNIDYLIAYSSGNILDLTSYVVQHSAEGLVYIDLSRTANRANTLIIDDSALNALAGWANPYALKIIGDTNDAVTAIGATATGNTVNVGGVEYVEYSFGVAGITFYVAPTVTVTTSL
jgi:hypothetical protein